MVGLGAAPTSRKIDTDTLTDISSITPYYSNKQFHSYNQNPDKTGWKICCYASF